MQKVKQNNKKYNMFVKRHLINTYLIKLEDPYTNNIYEIIKDIYFDENINDYLLFETKETLSNFIKKYKNKGYIINYKVLKNRYEYIKENRYEYIKEKRKKKKEYKNDNIYI